MSDNLFSNNFSQGNGNFSFWDDVVVDGTFPKQFLQDDDFSDNTNSQGLLHVGYSEKVTFTNCEGINFTQCMMELDNSGGEILTFEENSGSNCETQTCYDLNIPDLLQSDIYGFDENMMNCVNVFQMNNLSVFPGVQDDSTESVDVVEQWSCCSPRIAMELISEESLTGKDNHCFQVRDSVLISQDDLSTRDNSVEQLPYCSSAMKTNKLMSDEISVTDVFTECNGAFQVNNFSQLPDPSNDCSERGDCAIQPQSCPSKKATMEMVDDVFLEQDGNADEESSNAESLIYESDNERLTLGPTSQQRFSDKESNLNVVVNNSVGMSGPETFLPVLSSNITKGTAADCNASKPKRLVLQVIRKSNTESGTKMLTGQADSNDVIEVTSQPSFVNCNRNTVTNHRSTGDESDSTMDSLSQNLNKSAIQARLNRERKKAYIAGLEKEIGVMTKEKANLERKVNSLEEKSAALDDQVMYLKSVLANESVLAKLISNINGTKIAELHSSSVMGRKRKLDADFDDRRSKEHRSSGISSGVCLHVSDERLSLELCHHCARSSEKTD